MAAMKTICVVLLTYKGKILAMHTENNPLLLNDVTWRFIGRAKEKGKTVEETIYREVERETGMMLSNIELVATINEEDATKYFYHARLTDTHVNNMQREDGQTIQFFSLKEMDKLQLSPTTKQFMDQYRDTLAENSSQ